MAKPVYATCTCEANLGQLRTDWNTQPNPDLIDIQIRLLKISQDHLRHAPGSFGQFQNQYFTLAHRLTTEQGSSPAFITASEVKKSTGARMVPASSSSPALSSRVQVVRNPSAPPAPKPQLTRQATHFIPDSSSSSSAPQPRSGFRILATTPPQSPPQPSPDSSKTTEGHDQ